MLITHRPSLRAAMMAIALGTLVACAGTDTVAPSPQLHSAVMGGASYTTTATTVVNLVANASLETAGTGGAPASWSTMTYGSPAPSFSNPVPGRSGNGAAVTLASNSNGDARWQHASVAVTAKAVYTFGIWYKSTAATSINMEFEKKDGKKSYGWLADLPSSGGAWVQYTATFTVPKDQVSAAVYQLLSKAGTLTIDDAWLAAGNAPPPPPANQPTMTLTANPTSITSGQSSTLTWSATDATSCIASGAWSGAKSATGMQSVTPSATATYTLTCSGTGGSVSQSATVTVSSAPPSAFAEGLVSITFDDSYEQQYLTALPILQTAGFKGTFYLTTQFIAENFTRYMKPAQVQDIANKGHEIAGHTVTHPNLTTLSAAAVIAEVTDSRTYLQNLTGKTVTSFADRKSVV